MKIYKIAQDRDAEDALRYERSRAPVAKEIREKLNVPEGDDSVNRRRSVRVLLDDGDVITTEINGTKQEITNYYLDNQFVAQDETTMRSGVKVEFLD